MKTNEIKQQDFKKVVVLWEDITLYPERVYLSDLNKSKIQEMETTGFLIKKEKDYLIIASTLVLSQEGEEQRISDFYKIPIKVIKKITYLK